MKHYLTHLALANEIQPVMVIKDILSKNNDILLPQGERISHEAVAKLQASPLAAPIEFSIALEDELTGNTIYQILMDFIQSDPGFKAIFDQRDMSDNLQNGVEAFAFYDILCQKLNVLAIQLPSIFDQSLFSAWMVACVYSEGGYPQFQINSAFIAALSHDFGLLEVSPDILFKEGPLSADDWVAMQQHPSLGATLLSHFPGIDAGCIRAVQEHHESVDGTGYPNGTFEKKLCDLGRLLHTLDSTNAIYRKYFKHQGRTLHDLLPVLQMTSLSRQPHFSDELSKIIKLSPKTEHSAIDESLVPAVTEKTQHNAQEINTFINISSRFTKEVGSKHGDIKVLTIQNIAHLIQTTMSSCGIINDSYMRWLDQVKNEKLQFAYRELEDVLLMTEEIKFHIIRCERHIKLYLGDNLNTKLREEMSDLCEKISAIPHHSADEKLKIYLKGSSL